MNTELINFAVRRFSLACDEFRFLLQEQKKSVTQEYVVENIEEAIEKIERAQDMAVSGSFY